MKFRKTPHQREPKPDAARKKELKEIAADSLGVDLAPKLKVKTLAAPPKRQAGRKGASVQELVQVLHTEAKVI